MNTEKWIKKNTMSLSGKTVAISGTTGGLGNEICKYIARLGASLILLDRNTQRSENFRRELIRDYGVNVKCINVDMQDIRSVMRACEQLKIENVDFLINNAGAYSIPRCKCETGFDNIFQINFISPYYITRELLPILRERGGKVIYLGSIAHNYSKSNSEDVDFSHFKRDSRVYGNAKRYMMFSLFELFKAEDKVSLSIAHPGITFTNITSHYPKVIFAVIKYPMKIIFMKPKKACLSVIKGIFDSCGYGEWIGPHYFDIWGTPKKKVLNTCSQSESQTIGENAEKIYEEIKKLLIK